MVRTDVTGRIYPEGEVLPPRPAEIEPVAPGLPAAGIPLDEFRPGDPLFDTAQEALGYKEAARSPATKRAYESDFRLFAAWCGQAGLESLPATISTIGLYVTDLATGGAKVSTISRKLAAISFRHKEDKLPSPCSMKTDPRTGPGLRRHPQDHGNKAGRQGGRHPQADPEDGRYRGGQPLDRLPGPGPDPDRVRGRPAPLGTGRHPLRTPPVALERKRDHHYAAQVEDRPGGAGKGSRDRPRQPARKHAAGRMHLPGPGPRPVAAPGRHRRAGRSSARSTAGKTCRKPP